MSRTRVCLAALGLAVLLLMPDAGRAKPPPGLSDPAVSAWFRSLRRNHDGFPCCSESSDCRRVDDVTHTSAGYTVEINREDFVQDDYDAAMWKQHHGDEVSARVDVVPAKVVIRPDNPTRSAVLCYSVITDEVYCFVPYEFGG
jgi:hypothetical protein